LITRVLRNPKDGIIALAIHPQYKRHSITYLF
jgi:hypothetical protein